MPQAMIPMVVSALATVGVTGTAATVASWIVVTALSLGASYALQQLTQKKPKHSPQQITLKQAMPPRYLVYGRDMIGGAFVFRETIGKTLYQIIAHGQGPWDAIESYHLDDTAAGASIAAGAPAPWLGHVRGVTTLGTMTQPAFAELVAAAPTQWTEAHRLAGVAATLMTCQSAGAKFNAKIFPNGVPGLRVLARGQADIHDPRDGGARWTENAGLVIRDYLVRRVDVTVGGVTRSIPVGLGVAPERIEDGSFAAFALRCDEPVMRASGVAEPRYVVSTTIDLSQTERRAALAALLRSCDAELYPTPEGKIAIRGGAWTPPTQSLGADDVIAYDYAGGTERVSGVNRLKVTCKSPVTYQPAECEAWEDLADQAARGVLQQDFDAQSVPSPTQARRLARIQMMRINPRHRITLTVSYGAALRLWGERNFALTLDELLLADTPFFIDKIALSPDSMTGTVEASSEDGSAYDWSPALEGAPPVVAISAPVAFVIPAAPAPTLSVEWSDVSSTLRVGVLRAQAPEASGGFVARFEYRQAGETAWRAMDADGDWGARVTPISDATTYEARAAYASPDATGAGETMGAWSGVASLAVVANAAAPVSSGLGLATAADGATAIMVTWTTPDDPNLAATRVYVGATDTFADATLRATSYVGPGAGAQARVSPLAAGSWRVWVRAVNGSGVAAAPLGPASITL